MRLVPVMLVVAMLAGCGSNDDAASTATASTAADKTISGINIDTDGFKANVEMPGLSFGGDDMDLDGMKLYPGSTVRGVRVKATKRGGAEDGGVTMDFTSPAEPAKVAAHFEKQARDAGYTVSGASAAGFGGVKNDGGDTERLALAFTADGAATKGQLTLTGSKSK